MITLRNTASCAVNEMTGFSYIGTPDDTKLSEIIATVCKNGTAYGSYGSTAGKLPPMIYLSTGPEGEDKRGYEHADALTKFIHKHGLGDVVKQCGKNEHHNGWTSWVWVWSLDHEAMRKWYAAYNEAKPKVAQ